MKRVRFFVSPALSVLLIASVRNAEPQSADLPKPEKRMAVKSSKLEGQGESLGGRFYLERGFDGFGIRSHGVIEKAASGSKLYPLPQSDIETYKRLRPEDLKYVTPELTAKDYHGQEVIGPHRVEGDRLWFGNQSYEGEGERGVGAFGYFDMKTRTYTVFSPPAVARWEVSAILVEPDAVWLALDSFGEDISTSPGGMIRWDRNKHTVRRYPLEFVVDQIRRDADNSPALFLRTTGGYALFRNGQVRRFRTQKSSGAKDTAVPIDRFPPGPSIQ
jgi:hypothetical protein